MCDLVWLALMLEGLSYPSLDPASYLRKARKAFGKLFGCSVVVACGEARDQ